MMRALWVVALLVCLALANVSCGTGGTAGAPDDDAQAPLPPDVVFISNPAAAVGEEPLPDGYARLLCSINWPGVADGVSARRILDDCTTIDIAVTGSGISSPVTATITRPDATASLVVRAGLDRTVAFEEKDASTAHMATTRYLIDELVGGQTYDLSFILLDDQEPNDNADDAYALAADGSSQWSVLHQTTDAEDWFKFDVTGAPNMYLVECNAVTVSSAGLTLDIIDTDKTTVLWHEDSITVRSTATIYSFPVDGTYYVRVTKGTSTATAEYRLSVNDDEGSTDVNFTVE